MSENAMSNTSVIAGAVVGSVGGTALIAVVAFLLYRRSKKTKQEAPIALGSIDEGKPELDSTSVAPPPPTGSPSPSITKSRMEAISPVSAVSSPYTPPPMPELYNQPPRTSELQGRESQRPAYEAYSQQVYEVPGQPRPTGLSWQSGPVPNAYEMDGSQPSPHAR